MKIVIKHADYVSEGYGDQDTHGQVPPNYPAKLVTTLLDIASGIIYWKSYNYFFSHFCVY